MNKIKRRRTEVAQGFLRVISCLAIVTIFSVAWAGQPTRTIDGTYDVQTLKEVTSIAKLNQVCLEDIARGREGVVTQVDRQTCGCVVYELGGLLSYREYQEVENNILYGRDWKGTEAMRKTRPQLVEACGWTK
jgi:hypothetical protein